MNDDPLEALVDLTVVDGKPVFRLEEAYLGCPCAVGWFGAEWLYRRKPRCTCGAGDPEAGGVLHEVSCDAVPCPFCPAEEAWRNDA